MYFLSEMHTVYSFFSDNFTICGHLDSRSERAVIAQRSATILKRFDRSELNIFIGERLNDEKRHKVYCRILYIRDLKHDCFCAKWTLIGTNPT